MGKLISRKIFNDRTTPYILLAPSLIFVMIMILYPVFRTIYFSFTDYRVWAPNDINFIGLENYVKIFTDSGLRRSLTNTFIWVIGIVSAQFIFGMILAMVLRQNFVGKKVASALILIPWITPNIVAALIWSWLYNGNYGVLNHLLLRLGIIDDFVPWLAKSNTALACCMLVVVWQGIAFFGIMLLSNMMAISDDLYEAAHIDGASALQSFINITLPSIKETIYITTILRVIWVANNVDIIFIMTYGGPGESSMTLAVNTFITAQRGFRFGMSSSMAVLLALILSVVAYLYLKLTRASDQ